MKLTLAERDLNLLQIEAQIKNKKNLLLKKKKDLNKKNTYCDESSLCVLPTMYIHSSI